MPAPSAYTLSSNRAQAFSMLTMLREGQLSLRKLFLIYSYFYELGCFHMCGDPMRINLESVLRTLNSCIHSSVNHEGDLSPG